jgi:hypothetical protein
MSGRNGHYKFVFGAGAIAKSVTNNLPLLSVFCGRSYFILVKAEMVFDIVLVSKVSY